MGYIRVYRGDELTDQFELTTDRLTIGRATDNDLVLNDPGVSRNHAAIVREGSKYFIEDNQSSNGVFVNKQRIERQELNYWDEIQIYKYVLKFMAVSRRGVESDSEAANAETKIDDGSSTVALTDAAELERLRKQKKTAYVVQLGGGNETHHDIKTVKFSFGRAGHCEVRLPGFLTPGEAAYIERSGSSYQLIPLKRGKVRLNGQALSSAQTLKDEDKFEVRNSSFQFFHRLVDA